jgi:hypothetical protein
LWKIYENLLSTLAASKIERIKERTWSFAPNS